MKAKLLLWMLVIFVTVGCSSEKEVIRHEESNSTSAENRKDISQKPPSLKVNVNGEEFFAATNGYSWSYFDEKEKSMAGIEAEVVPVSDLIGNRIGPAVNSDTSIELKFEEEPISYEVYVLGSPPHNRGTDVDVGKQTGRTIYEVKATWEQGTGYYIFPLTIE
ncbi:hypothetical protein [Planococcus alpniumensis]|uniref:hypothetical protein n=1 Tax=Planococcus alpniumensis TaxID=2708345 RepID=UPI001B8B0463|nr:hypothetical protein [Planococcus sp. MSAK28401]